MTTYNVLIEVPDDLDITEKHVVEYEEEVPVYDEDGFQTGTETATKEREEFLAGDDVAWEIVQLYTEWPALVTPGTGTHAPTKLMHCMITTDVKDVQTLLESLIIAYELDWTLLHVQTFHAAEGIPGTDPETGEEVVVGYQAAVLLSTALEDVQDYLQPRYTDETQTVELKKDISWLHVYQGMASWRLV